MADIVRPVHQMFQDSEVSQDQAAWTVPCTCGHHDVPATQTAAPWSTLKSWRRRCVSKRSGSTSCRLDLATVRAGRTPIVFGSSVPLVSCLVPVWFVTVADLTCCMCSHPWCGYMLSSSTFRKFMAAGHPMSLIRPPKGRSDCGPVAGDPPIPATARVGPSEP